MGGVCYFAAKDQIRHANFVFHYRPSKLLAPAKIEWSKLEYADEQEPPWGTSTKPPEPFDTPKQSTCKLQYTHYVCHAVRVRVVCVLPDMVLVLKKLGRLWKK